MTRTHGSREREPHGARRAEDPSSRVVAEIRLKSEFLEQENVELSAANGLAVPLFSRQDAPFSALERRCGLSGSTVPAPCIRGRSMFYWLYDLPTSAMAGWFAVVFVSFSWIGAVLIRPLLRPFVRARLGTTNDLVGYLLSCYSVFYGLLLGLLAVAAYQNYSQVELAVSQEAASLAALYDDASAYPDPVGENLRLLLRDYCRHIIKYSWPLMRKGNVSSQGWNTLTAFRERLVAFEPRTKSEEILVAETLRQYNRLQEFRQLRRYSTTAGIPTVMWYVVVVGSVINIALVWLFDMRLITHLFLGGLLAFFIATLIFLIAALDHPFRGEVSIPPDVFEKVYESMLD
jgi:hypothetical protein